MAIGNIVCRSGVGPTSTIALFITHGLGVGAAPVSTKVGGDDAWLRKRRKDQQAILEAKRQEKLEASQLLRRQIEEAVNPSSLPVSQLEKVIVAEKKAALPTLQIDLQALERELSVLQNELKMRAQEMRRLREEDDIQAIMAALNHPFQTRH